MQSLNLTVISPCKINLFLYILGKREDGFHNLQSLFCLLNHGDEMHFAVKNDGLGQIVLLNDMGFNIKDNLIYKAVRLLQEHTQNLFSVSIDVNKVLPMGGGLGGGSSNAATTLLVINQLAQLNLSQEELCELGASLGSDVPFFIHGVHAFVEGRGEIIHPISLDKKYYLVITPDCHVATKEIFTDPELKKYYSPQRDFDTLLKLPFSNDCLSIVRKRYCEVGQLLDRLVKYKHVFMSGTGASCFIVFEQEDEAKQVYQELLPLNMRMFLTHSINQSPVHEALAKIINNS